VESGKKKKGTKEKNLIKGGRLRGMLIKGGSGGDKKYVLSKNEGERRPRGESPGSCLKGGRREYASTVGVSAYWPCERSGM